MVYRIRDVYQLSNFSLTFSSDCKKLQLYSVVVFCLFVFTMKHCQFSTCTVRAVFGAVVAYMFAVAQVLAVVHAEIIEVEKGVMGVQKVGKGSSAYKVYTLLIVCVA